MFARHLTRRGLLICGFFLTCFLFLPYSAFSKTKTIRYHPGGSILKVNREVDQTIKQGAQVRITGRCISSCTLYLRSNKLCITKTASFKFHQAQYGTAPRSRARPDYGGTKFLMDKYPRKVRKWIEQQGGLPWKGWLTLNARTAVKHGIAKYC